MRGWPLGWGDQGNQPQGAGSGGDGRDKSSLPDWGWGATVEMVKKASSKAGGHDWYEVTVLMMCKPGGSANGKRQQDSLPTPMVRDIGLDCSLACHLSFCTQPHTCQHGMEGLSLWVIPVLSSQNSSLWVTTLTL